MNKKLLKSVAALFAVAVLGVSCSEKATDPQIQYVDKPVKVEDTREALEIFLATPEKVAVADKTTQVISASSSSFASQKSAGTEDVKFVGADVENIAIGDTATGKQVRVEIISILGLPNNKDVSASHKTNVDLSGDFATNVITLGGDNSEGFSLTGTADLNTALQAKSFDLAQSKGAVVVTLRFTDLSGEKKPVEIPVYVALKGVR